jgi:hypothetical protein
MSASNERLAAARQEFEQRKLLHLPKLLAADLAERVRAGLDSDGFEDPAESGDSVYRGAYQGGKVGQDLRPGDTARLLAERTNDRRLLDFVAAVIGSPRLVRCVGRVFRLYPMAEDLPWHTDAEGGRVADLIIHLSPVPHGGGLFQMRDAHTRDVFNEVGDMAFGDGLLIRISPAIEHHYKAVTGSVPKVTFSGWFVPEAAASHQRS